MTMPLVVGVSDGEKRVVRGGEVARTVIRRVERCWRSKDANNCVKRVPYDTSRR